MMMNLEANPKGNEVGSFDAESSRFDVVRRALGPDNGGPSLPISSHEYIGLTTWNDHLFSAGQNM